jgi:hypothetical protein
VLLFCGGFQIVGEGVKLRLPELAVLGDPIGGLLHGLGGETEAVDAAVDFAAKQAGGFEDAQVFGDGRERHAERFGEFGDFSFAEGETGEDGAAGGVGESAEGVVE